MIRIVFFESVSRMYYNIRGGEEISILIKTIFVKTVEVFLNLDNYPPFLISFHVYYISRIHVYVQSHFPPLFAPVHRYKSYRTLSPYSIGKRPMNKHRYSAKVAFDCHYLLPRDDLTRYYTQDGPVRKRTRVGLKTGSQFPTRGFDRRP